MKNCGGGIEQLQQNNAVITQAIERINTAIEAIQNASTKAVRHIQKGTVSVSSANDDTITLTGFTNVEKMIVLFNGGRYIYASGSDLPRYGPRIKSISTDTLIVTSVQNRTSDFGSYDYTVIEFY